MHLLVIHSNDWQTNMLIQWFTMRCEHEVTQCKTEYPEPPLDSFDGIIFDFDTETITAAMNAVRLLRTRFPNLKIILFSNLDRNGDLVKRAFSIGATNYVSKQGHSIVDARDQILDIIRRR